MNDILNEAYDELFRMGMVKSRVDFSTRFLGKSRHYFSMRTCQGTECSLDAKFRLAATLKQQYELMKASRWSELKSESLYPLVRKVWNNAYDSALKG